MLRRAAPWVLLLALALRLPGLWTDFWLDEIWALRNVGTLNSALGVFTSIHHDSNHWLVSLWMYVVGQDAAFWLYRLPSLLAGLATVIVAGRLADAERAGSSLVMLLVAVSFPLGFYATEARGYAVAASAGLAAFLCLLRWLETRERRWLVAHWCAASAGLLAHLSFVAVLGAETVFLVVVASGDRRVVWSLLQPLVGPVVVFVLLFAFDLRHLQLGGGPPLDALRLLADVGSLALGGPVDSPAAPVVAVGASAGVLLAIGSLARPARGTPAAPGFARLTWVFYAAIFVVPAVGALVLRPPFLFPRYFLVSLAFVPVVLVLGLKRLPGLYRPALVAVWLALNGWSWVGFAQAGRGHYAEAVADMVAAETGAVTVSSDHDFRNSTILDFYRDRAGLSAADFSHVESGGQFFIVSERGAGAPDSCADCALLGDYQSVPLSGTPWRVYRRSKQVRDQR